ncbi:hypothetical protein N665_0611s0005 [Sinapis alba]|nr:hypothetical protein N665_0611s0005 [Sinapis alba]
MPLKTWPELVGTNGDYAASLIKRENPSFDVSVLLIGTIVTADFRENRVRVWVDTNRIVVTVPSTG